MTIKYFSMFSGIGGFEYGLQQSKHEFENVGYSEIDKYARSIYEKNYPNHINYGDATKINTEDLPDFEFLVGGFPCQAFSLAGKRKGFNDTRGTLFFEIARILKDKRPRYFLLENVKGILSHERGETIETIFRICDELGYDVSWAIYNSKDYGVPQNRERIFIKGYLRGECGSEVLFIPRVNRTVGERMSNTYYNARTGRIHKEDEIMNALACTGHNGGYAQLIQLNNDSSRPQGQGGKTSSNSYDVSLLNGTIDGNVATIDANYWKGLSPSDMKKNRRRRTHIIEKPLKIKTNTIKGYDEAYINDGIRLDHPDGKTGRGRVQKNKTGTITCNGNWGTLTSDYKIRRLTPVECERLQGFPDNFTKYGKNSELISDAQRYKCLGNAVTTNVITAIADEMFEDIDNRGVMDEV